MCVEFKRIVFLMAKKNSKIKQSPKVLKSGSSIKSVKVKAKAKPKTDIKTKKTILKKAKIAVVKLKIAKQTGSLPKSKTLEKLKKKTVEKSKKTYSSSKKEPVGKFELEYVINGSPGILYEFLATSSGLSEWFADNVNVKQDIYTFSWDNSEQKAKLLKMEDQKSIRLQWLDRNDGSYFEFRIEKDDITEDISLIVTDFADSIGERQSSKLLWDSQVDKLLHVMGAF